MDVLFICNGNVARSQEAQEFFNAKAGERDHATSAGINPIIGKPINPAVIHVMQEVGFTMDGCFRKAIDVAEAQRADVVVSFVPNEALPEPIAHLPSLQYWEVADPRAETIDFHRKVRDNIRARVDDLVAQLHAE